MGRKKRRKMRRSRGRRRRTTTMRRRERRRRRRSSRATAPSSPPGGRWGCGSRHRNFGLPRPDGRSSPQLLRRGPQPHLPLEGKKVCLTQKRRQYHSLNKPHQDTFTHARLTRMRVARNARGLRGLAARVEVPPSTSATYIARAVVPHPPGHGEASLGASPIPPFQICSHALQASPLRCSRSRSISWTGGPRRSSSSSSLTSLFKVKFAEPRNAVRRSATMTFLWNDPSRPEPRQSSMTAPARRKLSSRGRS